MLVTLSRQDHVTLKKRYNFSSVRAIVSKFGHQNQLETLILFALIFNLFNPLSANPTKWLLPMNCLGVLDDLVGLALNRLRILMTPSR